MDDGEIRERFAKLETQAVEREKALKLALDGTHRALDGMRWLIGISVVAVGIIVKFWK